MNAKEIFNAASALSITRPTAKLLVDRIRNELTVLSAPKLTERKVASVIERLQALAGGLDRHTYTAKPLREKVRGCLSDGRWHRYEDLFVLCNLAPERRRAAIMTAIRELARPEHGSCYIEKTNECLLSEQASSEDLFRLRTDLRLVEYKGRHGVEPTVANPDGQVLLGTFTESKASHQLTDKDTKRKR
jgi:hypothetical protein